jgi:hypothetical protein
MDRILAPSLVQRVHECPHGGILDASQ